MCRISWFYKNQIIEIYKLYSSLRSQVSSNLQYFYDDDKKTELNFSWRMRNQGKIHCKIVSMWDFFKNQIKLVKVVGVNLDKLTCATLPAAAPICKQPKVWLKQVPIVALLGPIFQLSWFSHGSSVIWCLQTLYQLLKRCGDLEKLRTTRESWNEVTSLETQHHSWRFSGKKKAAWLFAWW